MDIETLEYDKVEQIEVVAGDIDLPKVTPTIYNEKKEIVLGRTEFEQIPKKSWQQIADSKVVGNTAKFNYILEYFTVCVYSLKKSGEEGIASKTGKTKSMTLVHKSTTRETTTEDLRIALSAEGGGTKDTWSLKTALQTSFGITKVKEYIQDDSTTTVEQMSISESKYDRTIVFWDLVKNIVIYRKWKKGVCGIVAADDYMITSYPRTYRLD